MVFSADEAHGARRSGGLGCGPVVHAQKEKFKIVRVVVFRHPGRCGNFSRLKWTDQARRNENHQFGFVSAVLYVPEQCAENWDVAEQRNARIGGADAVIQHARHCKGISTFKSQV